MTSSSSVSFFKLTRLQVELSIMSIKLILTLFILNRVSGHKDPDNDCMFPFQYKGLWYYDCSTIDHSESWCSTTFKYSGKWMNCHKDAEVSKGQECFFPFEYKGTWYEDCTEADWSSSWCSKDMNFVGNWKHCKEGSQLFGKSWKQLPGALKVVSTGRMGVWGVNKYDMIYVRVGSFNPTAVGHSEGNDWRRISGALKEISSGHDIVWGVNKHSQVYYRKGITAENYAGTDWVHLNDLKLDQVSVSTYNNDVWGVDSKGTIYHREGITPTHLQGSSWSTIPGALKHVSVGQSGVWGVNVHDMIYYRVGTREEKGGKGSTWVRIPGALKQIHSGKNVVWGVNKHDLIYLRLGISDANPTGTRWHRVSGALKYVSVNSHDGSVWGVNRNDNIYTRKNVI